LRAPITDTLLMESMSVTCASFLLGAVFLIPFALAEGCVGSLFKASWLTWCSIIYLAISSSVIILWNHVIREMDVTKVMVSLYVIPIPTTIMSHIFLGETVTYSLILEGLIVTLGVSLTESSANTQSKAAHAEGSCEGWVLRTYNARDTPTASCSRLHFSLVFGIRALEKQGGDVYSAVPRVEQICANAPGFCNDIVELASWRNLRGQCSKVRRRWGYVVV
jgi:hypothetical protein